MKNQANEISETQLAGIFELAKLAELRDDHMEKHLERVRTFCLLLAENLSRHPRYGKHIDSGFTGNIYHASPLHDIGKAAIPDSILIKRGCLTDEEFKIMKTHADHGARTLETVIEKYPDSHLLNMGISISRHHHEKWDGSGYPQGLSGEDIPLAARIMAVADVYDALSSVRCYKPAFSHEYSSEVIMQRSGSHFDPEIVDAFVELQDAFKESREQMDK
ncbi:MAG: HD domain-containing phosphohydrolase [Acidobacteriota bacterium]